MSYLKNSEIKFPAPPVWLVYSASGELTESDLSVKLNPDALEFLQRTNGIVVPISSFDLMMSLTRERCFREVDVRAMFESRTTSIAAALQKRIEQLATTYQTAAEQDPVASAMKSEEPVTSFDWFLRGYGTADPEEQIRCYEHAISMDPKYASAYINRGVALSRLKRYDEAIEDYNIGLGLDPKLAVGFYNRGLARISKDQLDTAINDFTAAITLNADYVDAFVNRGFAWDKLGQHDKAIADYNSALSIDPHHGPALNRRGVSRLQLADYDGALKDFEAVLTAGDFQAGALYNIACVFARQSKVKQAVEKLVEAIELDLKYCVQAKTDSDFDSIRGDSGFKAVIASRCPGEG
jgi:tetratricopeptide (TPR) repeat protein